MGRFLVPLGAFLLLAIVLAIGLTKDPRKLPSPYIGKPAPEFELPSLTQADRKVGSASYAGQVALLNVWATWCPGCRQEHDFLLQLIAFKIVDLLMRDLGKSIEQGEIAPALVLAAAKISVALVNAAAMS